MLLRALHATHIAKGSRGKHLLHMLLPQAFVYKHCHDAAYDVLPRCESPRASLPAINLGGASSGWDPVSGWVVEEICQGIHDNKTFDGNGHAPCIALDRDDRADVFAQDGGSHRWLERASITRANHPDWLTPLITSSANLGRR